jgi:hypothetical protein
MGKLHVEQLKRRNNLNGPLGYATDSQMPLLNGAWRLLRLAVILWASLVLIRHATYWGGVIAEQIATRSVYRTGGSFSFLTGSGFPFAEVEAAAEVVILLSMLVIALGHRYAARNAALALRLLGAAFVLLVLTDIALNTDILMANSDEVTRGRRVLKVAWQVVSKLQLLVVPIVCAAYRRAA